ncbi:fatty acid desaturase family protein [Arsenicicoccus sp. oral taxon 190]|uniref:fatty acid desaturase family protein n=1 Tax=Arsenicicoccus sp. oral taxon 190 TaxID=1658671 RepID=UPI00067A334A|nr:acyl-CoA desaturase [Arsenicicoccus sp. oral taxon 190]AKT50128.1 fatty acid desaturase [Arsenicicoccus sp. oral taxon 190]
MTALAERASVATRTPGLASTGAPVQRPEHARHLTDEQVAELGRELDALRAEVVAGRGAADAAYIRRVIRVQRSLELAGRATLVLAGKRKAAWVAGVGLMSVAKILENMEIGHNVIHGQWDWMRDPDIHSSTWEWDFVAPASGWKHTHNDLHHTWTNVIGKDSDVGYNLLRVSKDQPWKPVNLGNPLYNMVLAPFFEWGIAFYDLELQDVQTGKKSREALNRDLRALGVKAAKQAGKDYVATPLLAQAVSRSGTATLAGTFAANCIRNLWAHTVIFCGHFPDGVEFFSEEMIEGETRGDWYIRQMIGSCNISGSKLMHLMTGNLSHQIEHHLYPDLPSNRYAEIAVRVREICDRYGLPYVTGPLHKQIAQTWRTVFRLALP